MTDSPSALAGYISSDFGQVESTSYTERIGMNYVKCKVVGNTKNIYIPVQEGKKVYLAERDEIMEALGLNNVKHKLPAGYIEMYEGANKQTLPVFFNSHFSYWTGGRSLKYIRNIRFGFQDLICYVPNESNSRLCSQR